MNNFRSGRKVSAVSVAVIAVILAAFAVPAIAAADDGGGSRSLSDDGIFYAADGLRYRITSPGHAMLSDGHAAVGHLDVPSEVWDPWANKYTVSGIGVAAFESSPLLTSITLPDSVKYIQDMAFYHCFNLTSVTMPASLQTLGNEAFAYCYSLTALALPYAAFGSIGAYALPLWTKIAYFTGASYVTASLDDDSTVHLDMQMPYGVSVTGMDVHNSDDISVETEGSGTEWSFPALHGAPGYIVNILTDALAESKTPGTPGELPGAGQGQDNGPLTVWVCWLLIACTVGMAAAAWAVIPYRLRRGL